MLDALPKVSLNGVTGHEVSTQLGTAITWQRGGVALRASRIGSVRHGRIRDERSRVTDGAPVAARGLVKRYGDLVAVDGVDLSVEHGDVFGYLGPNGAGKTTSLRMLLGLIRPTSGSVHLFGRDVSIGAKALEGVAGFVEGPTFYPYLSARKNLTLLADYDGRGARSRIDEVLDVVDLRDRAKDRVGGYSHGMRQRLGIAAALLREPRLLLLDEPTTGLDPAGMRDMRDLVRRLAHEGLTVLLSSHLLTEVEELCNRVAIIRKGASSTRAARRAEGHRAGAATGCARPIPRARASSARRSAGVTDVRPSGGELRFTADEDTVASLSLALGAAGIGFTTLAQESASLEELFLPLTEGERAPRGRSGGRA